jgi:hypothetical protein
VGNTVPVFRDLKRKRSSGAIILQSRSRSSILAALALAIGMICSGCLAMAIPEVAYEGYKFTHKKEAKATPAPTPAGRATAKRQPAHAVDESIE